MFRLLNHFVTILPPFKLGFIGLSEAAPAKELEGLGQSLLSREQLPSQGRGERNFGV
jgi:hypothetical protein